MATPIWKDYYVNFGNVDSVDYEIRLTDGTIIFSGRSHRKPEDVSLQVKINDICADFLSSEINMDLKDQVFYSNDAAKEFEVYVDEEQVDFVSFSNDWSYKEHNSMLNDPIKTDFVKGMPILVSLMDGQYMSIETDLDYIEETPSHAGVYVKFPNHAIVTVDDQTVLYIESKAKCNTHALYYVNAYGGWDFLLMEGRTIETDDYTRYEHKREYDNRKASERGIKNYLNEVEKSYVLHTGWLKNDEAAKMHHLLGSTDVYLYDLDNSRMIPVVITDNSCKYKTFQNEGGKLVDYEINVKVAKEMIRR